MENLGSQDVDDDSSGTQQRDGRLVESNETINKPHFDKHLCRGLASVLDDGKTIPASHATPLLSVHVNDNSCRRPDGSLVAGLTRSLWEAYVQTYSYLSKDELTDIRDTMNRPLFDKHRFEDLANYHNNRKRVENRYGKYASPATSLFMLISVHLEPKQPRESLSVSGEITSAEGVFFESDYIFRGSESDGNLILNGPSEYCYPNDACYILQSSRLSIRLSDQQGQHLFDDDDDPIILEYSQHNFEHVTGKVVQKSEISLTLKYVSIPMGVFGRLELKIFNTKFLDKEITKLRKQIIQVYGKVVATYKNTFGNYNSEEIVLFDKNPDQYVTLNLDKGNNLLSSGRCWVAAPVFSLLNLHIQLFDSETRTKILEQDVELGTQDPYGTFKVLVAGEFFISASASWFTPSAAPVEFEDRGGVQISRSLEPPLPPHSAIEIFSVLICHKEVCAELQIHGRLEFVFDLTYDFEEGGISIFEGKEEGPLSLSGRSNTIPGLNGSILYDDSTKFSIICDLKDTLGNLSIKGYECCDEAENYRVRDFYRERQLCSVFQGDNGFAAVHYSIFSSAMQAHLKVIYKQKESQGVNFPKVSGHICAQYADCDYSSQYKEDCYRIVFFKRSTEDLVEMDGEGSIPLSRSLFVVPSDSSVLFDVDLTIGTQKFSGQKNVPLGEVIESIQNKECEVMFVLEWSEVK